MSPTIKIAAGFFLSHTPPLFEEEGHSRINALITDGADPDRIDGPCFRTTLAADDRPINSRQV